VKAIVASRKHRPVQNTFLKRSHRWVIIEMKMEELGCVTIDDDLLAEWGNLTNEEKRMFIAFWRQSRREEPEASLPCLREWLRKATR